MKKRFVLIATICLAVYGFLGAAALSEAKDDLSEHDRRILEEFNLSLKNSVEGRFQTEKITDTSILIIDTKLGHLWMFRSSPEVLIKYAGQVYPGKSFWKTIYKAE
jgi:hypothetical protein